MGAGRRREHTTGLGHCKMCVKQELTASQHRQTAPALNVHRALPPCLVPAFVPASRSPRKSESSLRSGSSKATANLLVED